MKTLILTRHAKSDWGNFHLSDYDRTLNERGLRDAPMMGQRLLTRNLKIDAIVSSTARRAEQTALLISKELKFDIQNIKWYRDLYHAPASQIENTLFEQDNEDETILLICHNPGVTEFANQLLSFVTYDMPTCAMCAIQFETNTWEKISVSKANLVFYDYPKKEA